LTDFASQHCGERYCSKNGKKLSTESGDKAVGRGVRRGNRKTARNSPRGCFFIGFALLPKPVEQKLNADVDRSGET